MTFEKFWKQQDDKKWTEKDWASFRARGGTSQFATRPADELPTGAKPIIVAQIRPCIRAGFPKGAIVKAWRTNLQFGGACRYWMQDADGDLQSAS